MSFPNTISQIRKQLIRSFIPLINSLGVIKLQDELSSQEIVSFFKNANFVTSKLIQTETEHKKEKLLLVFNVERSFLIKYCKSLNLDGIEFLKFNRKPDTLTLESFAFESMKRNPYGGFKTIAKSIFNFGLDKNSINTQFSRLKKNPKFTLVSSKYKNMKYFGKRISYSKEEAGLMEEIDEMITKYRLEIQERQNLQRDGIILAESFKWKNRGIINNMFYNIQEIEGIYEKRNKLS